MEIYAIRDKETGEFSLTRDEQLARKWAQKCDSEIPVLMIIGDIRSVTLLGEEENGDGDMDLRVPR